MNIQAIRFYRYHTVIVGSGAAGYNAALRLYELGQKDIAIVTEARCAGTSRNTGSDKQTYYKLSLSGQSPDSVQAMAQTLFDGGCMDGDIAYAEAAGSVRSFFHLVELGVPFPTNGYGEYIGYKTDHDPINRGTSAGPYISRYMTEALERQALAYDIPVFDGYMAIRLLTSEEGRRACGIVTLDRRRLEGEQGRFCVFAAENVIWATGGEAGMYRSSVYPYGQNGGSGVLFEAGAAGKNLTEWQYGIASTRFRWNLSGSFQQAVPRYVSTDAQGGDEREFLADTFSSPEKLINAIFLKGYQWPFDPRKVANEGSSLIDVLIYQEEIIKGRRIFMDYTRNPAALERGGKPDFSLLSDEAESYLSNCSALLHTPYERLRAINPAAIQVYMEHRIDSSRERLEISVCVQHNNGGIPMVIINRTFDINAPCINICNDEATRHAARYLLERGHRRIAVLSNNTQRQYNDERMRGCTLAFEEAGCDEYQQYLVTNLEDEDDIYRRTVELMKRETRPTAILVFNDNMAMCVYQAIADCGLRIPDDVSVVGFDDIPTAKYMPPPLTTIRHATYDTLKIIFNNLMYQIKTREFGKSSFAESAPFQP